MFFCPDSRYCLIFASPAFTPSTTAAFCSGESALKAKVFPASTPRRASFSRIAFSCGSAGGELRAEPWVVEKTVLANFFFNFGGKKGRDPGRTRLLTDGGGGWDFVTGRRL